MISLELGNKAYNSLTKRKVTNWMESQEILKAVGTSQPQRARLSR